MFRGRAALFDRLSGVFDNALIDRRSTVAPIDWYREPHGWQERTELYVAATEAMFEDAALKAIAGAGLQPAAIDGIARSANVTALTRGEVCVIRPPCSARSCLPTRRSAIACSASCAWANVGNASSATMMQRSVGTSDV